MEIFCYTPQDSRRWDECVASSRNGTFLHRRAYLDYRDEVPDAVRVSDCSLMAIDGHGHIVAVLPACMEGDTVYSHRYLTYGGWVMGPSATFTVMDEVWTQAAALWREWGVKRLVYKPVPYIYHRYPADDDLYWLQLHGARVEAMLTATVVLVDSPIAFDQNARRAVARAERAGAVCGATERWDDFWPVLECVLRERYGVAPVHSLEQIRAIARRCKGCVSLYTGEIDGRVEAGAVVYHCGMVDHVQYIAASEAGREQGLLPMIFARAIDDSRSRGVRYFDFGTSNEDHGRRINEGLIRQKTGMGGRTVVYPEYILDL